jgi:hypothetical protein
MMFIGERLDVVIASPKDDDYYREVVLPKLAGSKFLK